MFLADILNGNTVQNDIRFAVLEAFEREGIGMSWTIPSTRRAADGARRSRRESQPILDRTRPRHGALKQPEKRGAREAGAGLRILELAGMNAAFSCRSASILL